MAEMIPFIIGGIIVLAVSLVVPLWLEQRRGRGRWDAYYSDPRPRKRRRKKTD